MYRSNEGKNVVIEETGVVVMVLEGRVLRHLK
jgi:hypothetical protein